MDNNKKRLLIGVSAIAAAAFFVVLLIVGIVYSGGAFTKVMLVITSVLMLLFAVELGYFYLLSAETVPNYFLFNSNTNRNIPVSKLTFQIVNVRMNRYLSRYAPSEGKLWTDKILDDVSIDISDAYKPLVAYKLLYDLAERDVDAAWKCFEFASAQTVEFVAAGLEMNGDDQFAKALRKMKSATPINLVALRDMLVKNKRYLQGKMFKYTVQNINKF